MNASVARFAFHMLVLLACVIAGWQGPDRTPTREVVELVPLPDRPGHWQAGPPAEPLVEYTLALAPPVNAEPVAEPVAEPKPPRAPLVAQRGKAASRHEAAAARSAKTPVAAGVVKASCRPPTCRPTALGPKAAITKQKPGARPGRKAAALPAVFVPLRNLGLYLQARMGSRDAKPASAKRRR